MNKPEENAGKFFIFSGVHTTGPERRPDAKWIVRLIGRYDSTEWHKTAIIEFPHDQYGRGWVIRPELDPEDIFDNLAPVPKYGWYCEFDELIGPITFGEENE